MTEVFADTNLFIRFLTNDDEEQAAAVRRLLLRAKRGTLCLRITPLVIAEIAWVLESSYGETKERIRDFILVILGTPGITLDDVEIVAEAALLFSERNIDFIDAFHMCWMNANGIGEAYTFDKRHFSRDGRIKVTVPK